MVSVGLKVTHPDHITKLQLVEMLGSINPTISQEFFQNHIETHDIGLKRSKDPTICQ